MMSDDSLMGRLVDWLTRNRAQPLVDQPPTGADAYVAFEPTVKQPIATLDGWDAATAETAQEALAVLDRIRRETSDPYIRGELEALHTDLTPFLESLTGADLSEK